LPRQDQHGYTTYDAAVGVKKDAWGVELYGETLTDTRAQLYVNLGRQQRRPSVVTIIEFT
jgi:hypothetical protein